MEVPFDFLHFRKSLFCTVLIFSAFYIAFLVHSLQITWVIYEALIRCRGVCFLSRLSFIFFYIHFILKFALHGCKIETTQLRFLEKRLQKKNRWKNIQPQIWPETLKRHNVFREQLLITFIYFACGGGSMGKCMMYVLVWTHVPLLLCVCDVGKCMLYVLV